MIWRIIQSIAFHVQKCTYFYLLISNIKRDQVLIAKNIGGDYTNASSIIADQKDARGAIRQEAYQARFIVG
jgi:hypothetical protein